MNGDIYNEAYQHFLNSGKQYEYGRPDTTLNNRGGNGRTDGSRTEQDTDGDGRAGVDCSSLVWRGLHDAGYDVGNAPFGTSKLFWGNDVTAYSKEHFDVVSAADASKRNGSLQAGDVIMFEDSRSTGQHVGIVKGYDENGRIQFLGSQVSTGPKEVTIEPGGYWDGGRFNIVGALRAKPEFQVREPVHGQSEGAPAERAPGSGVDKPAAVSDQSGLLREGAQGADVRQLQELLKQHDARDAQGGELKVDGDFGKHTREAVEAYQKANKLEVDGIAGPETMRSLGESRQRTDAAPTMRDAGAVGNGMYTQAYDKLKEMGPEKGGYRNEQELERVAGSVAADASMTGLKRIDEIKRSTIGDGYFAVEGTAGDPAHHRAYVDGAQARTQTLEQSSQTLQQETQRQPQEPQPQQLQDAVRETPARTMLA